MPDIVHQVGIEADPEKVFHAIATVDGLKGWWTDNIVGDSKVGLAMEFRFPNTGPVMEVLELTSPKFIKWKCTDCIEEWIGTELTFEIEKHDDDLTKVKFAQRGWREETPLYAHCNLKWGMFMLSLKEYIETGQGRAFPNDIKIDRDR